MYRVNPYVLNKQIERRAKHEPWPLCEEKSEFYGREFLVTPDTLEPRSETETMIDLLKLQTAPLIKDGPLYIVDVGTGSGCLGITAKLELSKAEVVATDISKACIKIAERNAKKLGADVEFWEGDLLEPLKDQNLDVLLCNLPYVPDSHTVNEAAMFEPKLAIFGGFDGLDLYRKLFEQIEKRSQKPKYIFTESMPFQHHALATIARDTGYTLEKTSDFIQVLVN